MRREFWCPLYRVFGGLPLAQFFRFSDLGANWWGFVWNVSGMFGGGLCSSLRSGEGVGGDPGGFYRGVFAFLGTLDLFENSCECFMICWVSVHV